MLLLAFVGLANTAFHRSSLLGQLSALTEARFQSSTALLTCFCFDFGWFVRREGAVANSSLAPESSAPPLYWCSAC